MISFSLAVFVLTFCFLGAAMTKLVDMLSQGYTLKITRKRGKKLALTPSIDVGFTLKESKIDNLPLLSPKLWFNEEYIKACEAHRIKPLTLEHEPKSQSMAQANG